MRDTSSTRQPAAELLGVPADTSAEAARQTFLQRLERVDFVPPPAWCAGLSGLDERAQAGGFRCANSAESDSATTPLRAELKTFCGEYWNLSPEQRAEKHADLSERCDGDPFVRRHLRHLQNGLDIEAREFFGFTGLQANIAALIQETFPLPAVQRADARNARLTELRGVDEWRAEANSFWRRESRLAALDPDLFNRLDETPTGKWVRERESTADDRLSALLSSPPGASQKSGNNAWIVYVVVFVAIAILRGISGTSSSSSRSSNYQYQPPKLPNYQTQKFEFNFSKTAAPYTDTDTDTERTMLAELSSLEVQFQIRQDNASYRRLKSWLLSSNAATLVRLGHKADVDRAQNLIDEYERKAKSGLRSEKNFP